MVGRGVVLFVAGAILATGCVLAYFGAHRQAAPSCLSRPDLDIEPEDMGVYKPGNVVALPLAYACTGRQAFASVRLDGSMRPYLGLFSSYVPEIGERVGCWHVELEGEWGEIDFLQICRPLCPDWDGAR